MLVAMNDQSGLPGGLPSCDPSRGCLLVGKQQLLMPEPCQGRFADPMPGVLFRLHASNSRHPLAESLGSITGICCLPVPGKMCEQAGFQWQPPLSDLLR